MPQLCFDRLRERLLRAGVAPRHVRRYVAELRDHYDDLVREEQANGAARGLAETKALARLGNDDDLANVMLARPGLRSVAARFPWAVFGVGSFAMLIASLAAAILIEIGVLDLTTLLMHALGQQKASPSLLKWYTLAIEAWNTLAVYGAPLGIAALLYVVGARQRMSSGWIFVGIAIVCILGGFQNLVWYDTGTKGEMSLGSGLLPPYPHFVEGVARAAANLVLVGAAWWLMTRRPASSALESAQAARD